MQKQVLYLMVVGKEGRKEAGKAVRPASLEICWYADILKFLFKITEKEDSWVICNELMLGKTKITCLLFSKYYMNICLKNN